MKIFEVTYKKVTKEAINPGAIAGALGQRLAAYNASLAGLKMPDSSSSNAYGDLRSKAAAAAEPLIRQMAADELANWNRSLQAEMQAAGVTSLRLLPPQARQNMYTAFMNRVYNFFLDGRLGNDVSVFPKYVDRLSQSEAATLLSQLQAATRAILTNTSTDPATQYQQWYNLSKVTYDMRSLMQFNPAKSRAPGNQKMPTIHLDGAGKFRIGGTTLDYTNPLHNNIHKLIMSMMPSASSAEPAITASPSGDIAIGGYRLSATDPVEKEAIKLISAEIKKLNP